MYVSTKLRRVPDPPSHYFCLCAVCCRFIFQPLSMHSHAHTQTHTLTRTNTNGQVFMSNEERAGPNRTMHNFCVSWWTAGDDKQVRDGNLCLYVCCFMPMRTVRLGCLKFLFVEHNASSNSHVNYRCKWETHKQTQTDTGDGHGNGQHRKCDAP